MTETNKEKKFKKVLTDRDYKEFASSRYEPHDEINYVAKLFRMGRTMDFVAMSRSLTLFCIVHNMARQK